MGETIDVSFPTNMAFLFAWHDARHFLLLYPFLTV